MSTFAIDPISPVTLEQAQAASGPTATTNSAGGNSAGKSDSSHFSPLGQLINTLEQLPKTDPAKYKEVTQQIATNLQSAAQTAEAQGDSSQAKQLNALAADFSSASQSGQVSAVIQDLTPVVAGAHPQRGSSPDGANNQLLSLLQANESQNTQSTNRQATATILNTLNASGISTS
jgi:hypothetical protein